MLGQLSCYFFFVDLDVDAHVPSFGTLERQNRNPSETTEDTRTHKGEATPSPSGLY
jgi:hypothetical protein